MGAISDATVGDSLPGNVVGIVCHILFCECECCQKKWAEVENIPIEEIAPDSDFDGEMECDSVFSKQHGYGW